MDEAVTIILPLPPRALSPNKVACSRGGRMAKAAATKKCRRLAKEAVEAERIQTAPWERVQATEHFFYRVKRNRDERNCVAMLKAYYDGIVDAGLMPDDNFQVLNHGQPTFSIDRDHPRVEITLVRQQPAA